MLADESPVSLRNLRLPVVNPAPSLWGDSFTSCSFDDQEQETLSKAIERLKVDTMTMLMAAENRGLIALIDTLERLGLGYHFESEIEDKLVEIYNSHATHDLLITALRFRLLRQHRYRVSSSVFGKFTDQDNKFIGSLASDVEGLVSLYEATHTRISEDVLLEEALAFTTHHLTTNLAKLESPLKDKVKRALDQPHHKGVPIIEIQHYIRIYQRQESRDELLVELAKLHFKFLQNLYKKELCQLSRWWNAFDLQAKTPFIRDRIVECYFWGVAIHFEPKYHGVRIAVAKMAKMVIVMDDIYDNYGTLEENQLLTDAYERWYVNAISGLPHVMKIGYRFCMSVYEDYVVDVAEKEKSFDVPYFIESVKQIARAFNIEQQWTIEKRMPSFEKYEENSQITSGLFAMITATAPSMTSVTTEVLDWVASKPKIVKSTAMIGRYLNNLASHERESKDGELLTVVDCFMNQHGTSRQETLLKFSEMVEEHWKYINEEWVNKTCLFPKEMVEQILNYARCAEVTYKNYGDGFSSPEKFLAQQIAALFNGPII